MNVLVVYLFRCGDNLSNKKRFLESYTRYDSGYEHDFRMVYKGFGFIDETSMLDFGYDLYSYRKIAEENPQYSHFVFFNSHTVILRKNWLKAMTESGPYAVVATSSSEESFYTNAVSKGFNWLNWLRKILYYPYPNFHIRTNGIFISRYTMLKHWSRFLVTKQLCYLFESGKNNLTNRLRRDNIPVYVVRGYISDNRCESLFCKSSALSHS